MCLDLLLVYFINKHLRQLNKYKVRHHLRQLNKFKGRHHFYSAVNLSLIDFVFQIFKKIHDFTK